MNGAAAVAWQRPRWRNQRTVLFVAAPASDAKQAGLVQKFSTESEEKFLFRFTGRPVAGSPDQRSLTSNVRIHPSSRSAICPQAPAPPQRARRPRGSQAIPDRRFPDQEPGRGNPGFCWNLKFMYRCTSGHQGIEKADLRIR